MKRGVTTTLGVVIGLVAFIAVTVDAAIVKTFPDDFPGGTAIWDAISDFPDGVAGDPFSDDVVGQTGRDFGFWRIVAGAQHVGGCIQLLAGTGRLGPDHQYPAVQAAK